MTKKEIIKAIGLDNYYKNQELANAKMLQNSKRTFDKALEVWNQNPTPATREFIGRVLSGIFHFNCSINEIK